MLLLVFVVNRIVRAFTCVRCQHDCPCFYLCSLSTGLSVLLLAFINRLEPTMPDQSRPQKKWKQPRCFWFMERHSFLIPHCEAVNFRTPFSQPIVNCMEGECLESRIIFTCAFGEGMLALFPKIFSNYLFFR